MTTHKARRGGILVVLLAALVGATVAAPASAAEWPPIPAPTSDGKVGAHYLVDKHSSPGVTCTYDDEATQPPYNYMYRLHVDAPVARARTGHTSQRIGFRYVVKGWNGTAFKNIVVSDFQIRTATPTRHAAFTGRTTLIETWDRPYNPYRVRVDLRWYSSSGEVVGTSSNWVEWYAVHQPHVPDYISEDACYANLG